MDVIKLMKEEMKREAETTRKMLALVPMDKLDWQPHTKSMTLGTLAAHVAEINGWVPMTLFTEGLDFSTGDYKPFSFSTQDELITFFEDNLREGLNALEGTNEEQLRENWTMRNGDIILSTEPKVVMLRHCFCQIVHHRAQLGVYLRLLDIPIPGSYGPSADDPNF